jgi:tRNA (cytidine/uridine-2'-O-)-methyltransferase
MDYLEHVEIRRHESFATFDAWRRESGARLLLATTKAARSYTDFAFGAADIVLFGRESAGAPGFVHASADARILVPMRAGLRSLNVALAAAMIAGEALRQTGTLPVPQTLPPQDLPEGTPT